jgi:hypothetical protein
MDLSALFKKKADPTEHFFGLFLRGDSCMGFIFKVDGGEVTLVAKELAKYSNGWEAVVDDVDELLAVLENETGVHVEKCIFFVYSYFVDQTAQDIRQPYKDVIKQLSKELDLKPVGYIECHEAVKDMIERKDGSPLNAVVVEADLSHVSFFVYKGGKLIHQDDTSRTDDVAEDLNALFAKKKEHYLLPSKLILYGSGSLEKESHSIREKQWDDELFIQAPRVNVVKGEELYAGLSETFMSQIAGDGQPEIADAGPAEPLDEETESEEPNVESAPVATAPEPEEPARVTPKKPPKKANDGLDDEAEKFGFVIGGDVTDEPVATASAHSFSFPKASLPVLSLPKLPAGLAGGKNIAWLALALAVIGGLGALEYTTHAAKIQVFLPSESVSDSYRLSANVGGGGVGLERKTITSEVVEDAATTGQREVGEKAKGSVLLHNFDDASVTLPAGTSLSVNGVSFVTDAEVGLPAARESSSSGSLVKEPGKKEVSVTAAQIGTEGNISKDTRMAVGNYSSSTVFALSTGAFSGGTKKQLKTIAKRDTDKLEEEVLAKAKQESNQKIKADLPSDASLVPSLTNVEIAESDYSGEVGQEANEVSVTAKVTIEYFVLKDGALRQELSKRLGSEVPDGFDIDTSKIAYKIDTAERKENDVNLNVLGEATAVKRVDTARIVARIRGKSIDEATRILKEEFEAEDVKIESNTSPLMILNGMLPFSPAKITVETASL